MRERWDAAATALRERFDEPLTRASEITQRTLGWFPIRVWRHFLRSNGFLLAASISYQALFAIFAVVYMAFAVIGIWLGASTPAGSRSIDAMIRIINLYIPNLISDHEGALISPDAVAEVARNASGVLAITGAVALVVAIWTAIGFVTFTRRAVRDIFGLPFDTRNYILLKARDLGAAVLFGLGLIAGAIVSWITSGALDALLVAFGMADRSMLSQVGVKALSALVAFIVNAVALVGLFRFLAGTSLPWRRIWPGSLLGGAAMAVLQVAVGLLLSYTPSNPLLATFSVVVAFLLWFRLVGVVILVAASWIAVSATDRELPLATPSATERALAEHEALLLAAHLHLRDARAARAVAPWYRRRRLDRMVNDAQVELARVEASAPPSTSSNGVARRH
ncbi:YihY/virulence factor BrkB family protein [Microbacterium protaetiae]|uniref:YihY/virulence factor BrkB family protein n=1 Tax=Microbacterium protaetiae TaxID=2509458 RepID=A0A4P6EGS9_9MICO|nr:YihY/virulence factor BrkB family protein [Microbacterium protaetiae]